MYWNHRVIKKKTEYNGIEWETFTIHEVYYDEDDLIYGWVETPAAPYAEELNDLWADVSRIQSALNHPVLNIEDLPGGKADGE